MPRFAPRKLKRLDARPLRQYTSYKPRVRVCPLGGRASIDSLTMVLVARCSRGRCGNERSRTPEWSPWVLRI